MNSGEPCETDLTGLNGTRYPFRRDVTLNVDSSRQWQPVDTVRLLNYTRRLGKANEIYILAADGVHVGNVISVRLAFESLRHQTNPTNHGTNATQLIIDTVTRGGWIGRVGDWQVDYFFQNISACLYYFFKFFFKEEPDGRHSLFRTRRNAFNITAASRRDTPADVQYRQMSSSITYAYTRVLYCRLG